VQREPRGGASSTLYYNLLLIHNVPILFEATLVPKGKDALKLQRLLDEFFGLLFVFLSKNTTNAHLLAFCKGAQLCHSST